MLSLNKELPKNYLTSGINLLYFGDKHYQFKKPANRTDDFSETEKGKVLQVRQIAKEHNCRLILQPGDFLDKPKLPEQFVEEILKEWGFESYKKAREEYEAGLLSKEEFAEAILDYIPIVGTVGNHELFGGSLKTLPRTTLGFLSSIGFINLVDKDNSFTVKTKGGHTVTISGLPYDLHLLKEEKNFILDKKKGDTDIFLIHEALYNTTLGPEVNWLPIDRVYKDTKADLTIAGHIHHGFGWIEKDGKIFGNPGVLAQQSSAETELDRPIVVSIIHISEEGEIFVKDIPLNTPTSREIFDLSQKASKTHLEEQMKNVQGIISKIRPIKENQAQGIIQKVAKISTNKMPKHIVEKAIDETQKVEAQMTTIEPLDENTDYTVKKIILDNFEAHSHSEINLPTNNVPYIFIGESSNGKSSIARALYFFFENEGNATDFIRRGKNINSCSVTLVRADGLEASRVVEIKTVKKRKTETEKASTTTRVVKNGWTIKFPDGTTTETNTEGLGEIQRLFGFNYIYLDEKEKLSINFRKQEDGHFFINLKPRSRAKVIGSIYGTQFILGAIKNLEAERRRILGEEKVVKGDIQYLEEELLPLNLLEQEEFVLNTLEDRLARLTVFSEKKNTIMKLSQEYSDNNKRLNKVEEFVKTSIHLEAIPLLLEQLETSNSKLEQIQKVSEKLSQTNSKIIVLDSLITKKTLFEEAEKQLSQLTDLSVKCEKAFTLSSKLETTTKRLDKLNVFLEHTQTVTDTEGLFQEVTELAGQLPKITKLFENFSKTSNQLVKFNQFNKVTNELLTPTESLIEQLTNLTSQLEKISKLVASQNELNQKLKVSEKTLSETNKELESLLEQIQKEKAEHNSIEFLGIKMNDVTIVRNGETMESSKLKELTSRYNTLKEQMIKAETHRDNLVANKEELTQALSELGIDPQEAPEKIAEIETKIEELSANIEKNLSSVEEVAKKLKEN